VFPPLSIQMQHLLPKQLLTQAMGLFARWRGGPLTQAAIRRFVARYRVDMSEAADPRPEAYPTFNEFFTRELKPGIRPVVEDAMTLALPVDGTVSQLGPIQQGRIIQAKGHDYSARELLGGYEDLVAPFKDGDFATIYLAPKDYHRIHMPLDGVLESMVFVPGDLFSVNPLTAENVPNLFARNERVVCLFEGEHGPFVLVLVGATIVGSMATTWHGVVNPPRPGRVREWRYDDQDIRFAQGEEMGRFLLGSTVVLLWPRNTVGFNPAWQPGAPVRLGEPMADRAASRRAH